LNLIGIDCVIERRLKRKRLPFLGVQRKLLHFASVLVFTLISAACATSETPNLLDPRGPAAAEIAGLWWLLFWMGSAVFVVVLVICGLAVFRSQRRALDDPEPLAARPTFLVIAGAIIPGLILIVVLAAAVRSSNVLLGAAAADDQEGALTIEVTGHQWWWEVRYPDYDIVTANEIHLPVGQPVEFKLTSRDVIHSFWVPQLHGKLDVIDGKIHTKYLEASAAGVYRGICAEFCGLQHSFMDFLVIAHPEDEFVAWLEARQAAQPLSATAEAGREVFLDARCDQCHLAQGDASPAPAHGRAGPDLTHLASRQTLAAGTLANTPANLADFIRDPHRSKPGVHMPATPISEDEILALVAYLLGQD
jgi:cytochrome c oxidase subunit II